MYHDSFETNYCLLDIHCLEEIYDAKDQKRETAAEGHCEIVSRCA